MKVASNVALGLAAFLFGAAAVYWFTAYERDGATHLLLTAVAFAYIGLVTRGAARHAEEASPEVKPTPTQEQEAEIEQFAPTIWPFGFSIAVLVLVLGVVLAHWILIVGGVLFAASAFGWFNDVRRQHHTQEREGSTHG